MNDWKRIILGLAAGLGVALALVILGKEDYQKAHPPTEALKQEPEANNQTDAQVDPDEEATEETATLAQKAVLSKHLKSYRLSRIDIDVETKGMLIKELEFILLECDKEYTFRFRPIKTMLEEIMQLYKNDSYRYKLGLGTYYRDIILRELEAIKSEINQLENE